MLTNLSGKTKLVPVLASPVDHVIAPSAYNPAFAERGLNWLMVPMGVDPVDLAATLKQLARVTNLQGVNLTIPHKAQGFSLCQWVTEEARLSGMVNTLRLEEKGIWSGTNTDGIGFLNALRSQEMLDLTRPVFVAGAGGAGTAIAFALAKAGATTIDVVDVDNQRSTGLLNSLQIHFPDIALGNRPQALANAGLAVNATPMGLHNGDPSPFDAATLREDAVFFDIIAARDTELMFAAKERNLRVLGGRAMIDHQLAYQIDFWRGDHISLERQD
jgi:shikimate dehydrogenase